MQLIPRDIPPRTQWQLEQAGIHPLLAQLYAARGITHVQDIDSSLQYLLPPADLKGTLEAAQLLAHALKQQYKLCIVADYDCDGATACSVAIRGLKLLGFSPEKITYIVPDRITDGYGLTPAIADRVKATGADLLITVDNGIASITGVEHARKLGLQVLVTDHHLPAQLNDEILIPDAQVIVNPNQPGCTFPSKALAGVGVVFYVLMALRTYLREQGHFTAQTQPRLDALLDLVALGTVADVVKLDANNRRLVEQGLLRMRKGQMQPGIAALFQVSLRNPNQANAFDMGFALGPRLNAAGRLSDMTVGIECLTTDDPQQAMRLAQSLDQINRARKNIEEDMAERSLMLLEKHLTLDEEVNTDHALPAAITIFDTEFHEGVVGILASRIKEKFYRPSFVFAPAQGQGQENTIKGSGRSIDGFHLRDALDLIEKRHPDLLIRFGGHAMAAGCTLLKSNLQTFTEAFAQVASELIDSTILNRTIPTDGPLPVEFCTPDTAFMLKQHVWGCGFAPPIFSQSFEILSQRIVGEKHLSLKLSYNGKIINAIWFRRTAPIADIATLAYRLDINEWQGNTTIQFIIEGMQSC